MTFRMDMFSVQLTKTKMNKEKKTLFATTRLSVLIEAPVNNDASLQF